MTNLPPSFSVDLQAHERLRGWWAPESGLGFELILEDAYQEAKDFLEHELQREASSSWLQHHHTLHDVLQILWNAKADYDSQGRSKTRGWLIEVSSRIVYFGTVLDVLVQHHPEYVSLVWGTFKFLFMAILNADHLVKELAKAVCQIAESLPRTEVIVLLYPTTRMRLGIAQLYKHILQFLQKAITWYHKGKISHAIRSIVKPWELEFEEDVIAIQKQSLSIEADANVASRAELRDAHIQIQNMQSQLNNISLMLNQTNLNLQSRLLPLQESQTDMLHSVLLNQVLSSNPLRQLPVSGVCLEFCLSFRNRRQKNFKLELPQVAQLSQWESEKKTKVLVTQGCDKKRSRDFLVDLTALIRTHKRPVLFALRFPNFRDQPFTFINLIQMLVAQALQINDMNFSRIRPHISAAQLQDVTGEKEWLHILNNVLRGLCYVFLVLDADLLNHAVSNDRYRAAKCIATVREAVTSTYVKIFVSGFSVDTFSLDISLGSEDWGNFRIDNGRNSNRKQSKAMMRRSRQRLYRQ